MRRLRMMPSDSEDIKKRNRYVQIKGDENDPLLKRLYAYANMRGLHVATAARMLLNDALTDEETRMKTVKK